MLIGVPCLLIEGEVPGELLVGVESDFRNAEQAGDVFGVVQQDSPKSATLKAGRYGDILDQQMIPGWNRFDQPRQLEIRIEQIDQMLA